MVELKSCKQNGCVHVSKKGKCGHKDYAGQDLRPEKPSDCNYFEPQLELVLRKGIYFIRNQITNQEVEFNREASAFSTEGEKKLDAMAEKLQVRRKDVWVICLAIPEEEEKKNNHTFLNEQGIFNPVLFAKNLLDNYFFKTTRDNGTLYVFNLDKGIYDSIGEVFVKEQMVRQLDENTRARHYNDVEFYIKGSTYFNRVNNPVDKIVVANGILDVVTKELIPHTPKLFIETRLPMKYYKDAKCAHIEQFIIEVVGKEQEPLIQEILGYCLYKALPYHKSIMLIGGGANGKSTLLHLIEKFLGAENVSHTTLQALCTNRFSTAQLYGKLANICDDLPNTALKQTSMFKMLTGGYKVEGQKKFKNPFDFQNYAKLIFSANQVPESVDDTIAFFRRWILIACNNLFIGESCNPKILDEITTPEEMSGLLNYALEGLQRLQEKRKFSTSENIEATREHYIRNSNSAKAFIEESLEFDPDPEKKIPVVDLYEKYITFCKTNQIASMQKRQFTINMQQHLPQARKVTQRIRNKPVKVWQYVKLIGVTNLADPEQQKIVTDVTTSASKHKLPLKNTSISVTSKKSENSSLNKESVTTVTNSGGEDDKGPIRLRKPKGRTPENKVDGAIGAKEPRTLKNEVNGKTKEPLTDFTVVECVDVKEPYVDRCAHCGKIEVLNRQIRTAEGKWGKVCKPSGEFFAGVVEKGRDADDE